MRIAATVVGLFIFSTTVAVARQQPGAQRPAAPAGPMARRTSRCSPTPAAQLDDTMHIMAATGLRAGCRARSGDGQFSTIPTPSDRNAARQ
jgi:hypothetical protein